MHTCISKDLRLFATHSTLERSLDDILNASGPYKDLHLSIYFHHVFIYIQSIIHAYVYIYYIYLLYIIMYIVMLYILQYCVLRIKYIYTIAYQYNIYVHIYIKCSLYIYVYNFVCSMRTGNDKSDYLPSIRRETLNSDLLALQKRNLLRVIGVLQFRTRVASILS